MKYIFDVLMTIVAVGLILFYLNQSTNITVIDGFYITLGVIIFRVIDFIGTQELY